MRKAALALGLDAGLAVLLLGPALAHPASVTAGGRQDAPYTVWAFAWVARALAHGRSPWVTNHLSWPGGVNLLTNATAMGLGIVLAPVTRIFGPLAAFNLAATGALAGTAWSAQLVLRRARLASWPAAFVGGVVAGFGPTSLAHTAGGHPHVTAAFLVPPLLLGIGRLAGGSARHPARWGAAVGLLAAAQLLIGEEILAITAIAAAVGLLVAVRRVRWGSLVTGGAVAGAVFVAVAAYPLWIQFAGPAHIRGPIQVGDHYPNDLSAFVVPIRQLWLGSGWSAGLVHRFSSEGGAYLGAPLLVAGVVAAVRHWCRIEVRVVAVAAAAVAVLSLGSHLAVAGHRTGVPLPWALVAHLPLLESLIPVRFGIVLDLALGALLAVAVDDAARWGRAAVGPPRVGAIVAGGVVAAVCVVPLVPRVPFRTTRWSVPVFFRAPPATVRDGALIVVSPYPSQTDPPVEVWLAEAGARWRSAGGAFVVPDAAGRVTLGGPVPVSDAVDVRIEQGTPAAALAPLVPQVRADLAARRVDAVLAGPGPHHDEVVRWWTALLGPPHSAGGVELWPVTS